MDDLARVLDGNGMTFSGVGGRLADHLVGGLDDNVGYWGDMDIVVRVVYEKAGSNERATKEGVVVSVDTDEAFVQFKRDDNVINRVRGDDLLSPRSQYPYMGDVVRVEVVR